jgi:hypothetical protein
MGQRQACSRIFAICHGGRRSTCRRALTVAKIHRYLLSINN